MQGTRWVFTINNPTDEDVRRCEQLGGNLEGSGVNYLIYGREVGESGTPHLQGFVIFSSRKRLAGVRGIISPRGHFEISRGTPQQASDYCKKGGDYSEFGNLPAKKRTANISDFCDWLRALDHFPSDREIANAYPNLWIRYQSKLTDLAVHIVPRINLEEGELREWQIALETELQNDPDDRTIKFYVDQEGGTGKSYFCRYMYTKYDYVQLLSSGKRDDLAFCIDVTKRIFLFNVPRGGMEYLQYTILESLKDRVVFSPKYWSQTKILLKKCHVVVFCNEHPDMDKMSPDRYQIINL
ncbi:MAG: putative viral replication protein [Persevirus pectis]|uniref:Viral replication protein n=1 Tax=Cressdnaviricota sp. TaxID=2748378 RepID=A0A345MVV0_9VIRU|nr:MAG: putative viral replication protein [Cressdnaviricota sp.]